MPRPLKCRRVAFMPGVTYFKPAGVPMRELDEVRLSVEEVEAVRLKDLAGLEQEQGAEKMNISRPTFQRILAAARQKIADALLNGKAIRIEGGNFEMAENLQDKVILETGVRTMKIALVTEDGTTISQHFGRAPYYIVAAIEDGKVTGKEKRDKAGHHGQGQHHEDHGCHHGEKHGFDAGAQATHAGMMANITDCQILIAGGMGWGAYEGLKSRNIQAVVTDVADIDEAIKRYLAGNLPNLMERLH